MTFENCPTCGVTVTVGGMPLPTKCSTGRYHFPAFGSRPSTIQASRKKPRLARFVAAMRGQK